MSPGDLRVGVDIGGTFTDVIAFDAAAGSLHVRKVPSTPDRPARAIVRGLERLLDEAGYGAGDVSLLSHGSTVTLNALIERTGPETAILLTEGFDAVPVAGSGDRPQSEVKNPRYRPPEPLVPRRLVYGIPERVGADGTVVEPLDEKAVRRTVGELEREGVESVAVAFLFAFVNPDHERRVRELIREEHPDCAVSLSSDVSPRVREYPRLSTTAVNAYVDPILTQYVDDLAEGLAASGIDPDTATMMLSHGGVAGFEVATETPVRTLLSGPVAGVQGALFTASLVGAGNTVMMDMGGTSCDMTIAPGNEPQTTTEAEFDRNPVSVRAIDVEAIGAGGGTIAVVEGGRLRVGPESAGADPGPVCYGQGGERVTVTDANAVLGRLNPDAILGGDVPIDVGAARAAVADRIADPLGLSVTEAAAGIVEIIDEKTKKGIALALTKRGYNPREFSLVAYGGAGPMHASSIARELSIGRVVVPAFSGINSAVGLLTSDRKRVFERSRVEPLSGADVDGVFADLREAVGDELAGTGMDPAEAAFDRRLELRYAGQSYELTVPVDAGDSAETIRSRFADRHREAFGHTGDQPLETMTYTIVARVGTDRLSGRHLAGAVEEGKTDRSDLDRRAVYFDGETHDTPIYRPGDLGPDARFDGPAVVEQPDTTVVVEPGTTARIDRYGNTLIELGVGSQ